MVLVLIHVKIPLTYNLSWASVFKILEYHYSHLINSIIIK